MLLKQQYAVITNVKIAKTTIVTSNLGFIVKSVIQTMANLFQQQWILDNQPESVKVTIKWPSAIQNQFKCQMAK